MPEPEHHFKAFKKKVFKIKCNWNGAFFSCFIHTSLSKKLSKKNDETRYKTAYHKRTWGNNQFSIKRTSFDVKKDIDIGWLFCVCTMWWRREKKDSFKVSSQEMKWKSKRQRLCMCVSNGTLSCIEFGMLNRKVHVTSLSSATHQLLLLIDICETICLYNMHTRVKKTYNVRVFFCVCKFFPKGSACHSWHCQHPCLMFTNQSQMKGKKGHNNKLMFNVSPENLLHRV